ncbi:MAG: hypothetical protein IT259_15695 [Saprospiraceae bacterium]|nr:hypothetical protein [Saprospiraceae bacterium]
MLLFASTITNLTDARYFAAREVDFLGFNLEAGTPGYLDPIYMKAMREWVEGPGIAGEFSQTDAETVREALEFYGLDAVLLHGAGYLPQLPVLEGKTVLLELDAAAGPEAVGPIMRQAAPWVRWFVLHFPNAPKNEDTAAWKTLTAQFPALLQLSVAPETLPALLADWQPAGLLLRGGEEQQVGVKSFDEIEEIFEALEK